jgi:hypothetical protein
MLTRTVISPSTIEKIRLDPTAGKHMINYLQEHGLLLLNTATLDELKKLPPHIFKTIEKDFFNGKIARAPWIIDSETYSPEVALSESDDDAPSGSISAHIDDYPETHPVSKRKRMKDGLEAFNREEWWTWIVEPIVASLPLLDRRIDIVDPYLFDHVSKMDTRTKNLSVSPDLGIIWFLRELRNTTIAGPAMVVTVYTPELDPPSDIDLSRINELCQRYLAPMVNDKFQINLRVIRYWRDRRNAIDLRDAYHGRRVFFNETREIILDKGMEDLTMMDRGKGYPETRIKESATYKRHAFDDYTKKFVGVMRDKYKNALWKDHPEYTFTL